MSQNPDAVVGQGEFRGHVQPKVLPAGTAPKSSTYEPNPDLNNQKLFQDASSTLTGATSGDVHTGLGHPGQGQTSQELHDGTRKGQGLVGLADEYPDKGVGKGVETLKDLPEHATQRNLDDVPTGQRGNTGGKPAQEREPEQL